MKIITFHYVRNFSKKFKYFYYYDKNKFIKFIDKYHKKIVSNENEIKNNVNKLLLTFDDGLKDHFFIAKELKKRNLIGIFFIPTLPYENYEILNVHLSHLILGKLGGKIALKELNKLVKKKNIKNLFNDTEKKNFSTRYKEQSSDDETKKFKKIINYYGEYKKIRIILKSLFNKFKIKLKFSDIYLTRNQIKKIHKMGMIIGCHSRSHKVLSRLNYREQLEEIKISKDYLENLINGKCEHFCFPYGQKNSYNKFTLQILKKLKFQLGYSVDNRSVKNKHFTKFQYELPRYDCNLFS